MRLRDFRPSRMIVNRRFRRWRKWRTKALRKAEQLEGLAVEHQTACDKAVLVEDNYALAREQLRLADKLFDESREQRRVVGERTWRWVSSKV